MSSISFDDKLFSGSLEAPAPVACEECGVEGEFVRFGKKQSAYRDLPMHGKQVTLWVIRRRYICRACDKTFRPRLPEIADGYRMTRRLHTHVEKEAFNHPYAYVTDTTGLDELYLNRRYGRGYSFEVMCARMLYTTKHKKKPPQTKESPFLGRATMTYSKSLPPVEKNYGVDLSTFWEE